jgi:hypothetical protein
VKQLTLVMLLLTGCGVSTLLRVTTATSALVGNGYKALNAADKVKQEEIQTKIQMKDPTVELQYRDYVEKRNKAMLALDGAAVAVETAFALIPTGDLVLNPARRREISAWTSTLLKLAGAVVEALDGIGIKVQMIDLGGGKP